MRVQAADPNGGGSQGCGRRVIARKMAAATRMLEQRGPLGDRQTESGGQPSPTRQGQREWRHETHLFLGTRRRGNEQKENRVSFYAPGAPQRQTAAWLEYDSYTISLCCAPRGRS